MAKTKKSDSGTSVKKSNYKKRKKMTREQKMKKIARSSEKMGWGYSEGDNFLNGIPVNFNPADYFVYFSSLASSKFWLSRALYSQVQAGLNAGLADISIHSTSKEREGRMGRQFEAAFNFLTAAISLERRKELNTVKKLRHVIEERLAFLNRSPAGLNPEKVKIARERIERYLSALDNALIDGDNLPIQNPEELIGLFNALRQNLNLFVSGVANSMGLYDEDTKERNQQSIDNRKAAGKKDKKKYVRDDANSMSKNSAAWSKGMRMIGSIDDIMGYLTNDLKASKGQDMSIAEMFARKLTEFFSSSNTQAILSNYLSACVNADAQFEAFKGMCMILVKEWIEQIEAELVKMEQRHELRKEDICKKLSDPEFLNRYFQNSASSSFLTNGQTQDLDKLAQNAKILEQMGSTLGVKVNAEAIVEKRKNAVEQNKRNANGEIILDRKNNLVLRQVSQQLTDSLNATNKQLFEGIMQKIRELNANGQILTIKDEKGANSNYRRGWFAELAAQYAAQALGGKAVNIGQYGGGTDNLVVGYLQNNPTLLNNIESEHRNLERNLAKSRQMTLEEALVSLGENLDFNATAEKQSATNIAINRKADNIAKIQQDLQKAIEKQFENGDLDIRNYFEFQDSVKQYWSMEMGAEDYNLKTSGGASAQYHQRSFKLVNFAAELKAMCAAAGVDAPDTDMVISLILNSHMGTAIGDITGNERSILTDYLSIYANLMAFDDDVITAKQVADSMKQKVGNATSSSTKGGYSPVHMFVLNEHYVPLSYILQKLHRDLLALAQAYEENRGIDKARNERTRTTTVHYEGIESVQSSLESIAQNEEIQPYSTRWSNVSETALNDITVQILFLKGFGNTIREIFDGYQF